MRYSCPMILWWYSSQYLPNSQKSNISITLGFCDGSENFHKFFSVYCEILVSHGQYPPKGEILYHGSALVIVPRFAFALYHLFRYLRKWIFILCFHLCVSTFEASPSESEFTLSEEYVRCNSSGIPCVGSSLYISSEKKKFACWFTVSRGLLVRICQRRFSTCMLVTSSRDWIWY